jgi:hypothetical protein
MYALSYSLMVTPTMTASATLVQTATATSGPITPTPSVYPSTATSTPTSEYPSFSPTPTITPTPYTPPINDIPYSPHCETYGIDYTNLTWDLVGIGLDLTPISAVDDLKTIQRLYSVVEVGGDTLSFDFEGYDDWYDWFNLGADVAGFGIPLFTDVVSIGANVVHSMECVEPK